jgi:chromosome segregation ATPase
MAVGVPENDVFAAADAVLARGERPTVERVRLELGRGSPARIGGLLDQWWARLAERLSAETRLPALPIEVSQAFVAVWQQAIQLAQGTAEHVLAEQRHVLNAERERVATVEDQARQDVALARQHAMVAQAARQVSEIRLADLEQMLVQRQAQIDDLRDQRDELQEQRDEARTQMADAHQQLQDSREQARLDQQQYTRDVEDRAYREIDRAREENKAAGLQLKDALAGLVTVQRALQEHQFSLAKTRE